MSKMFYKVEQSKGKITLDRKQNFVCGLYGLIDSGIAIFSLGYFGGSFVNRYIWNSFERNMDKVRRNV